MKQKVVYIFLILSLILLGVGLFKLNTLKKQQLSSYPKGGDFSIPIKNGTFNLADQRGKVVLLYFGYTFCPDICPTTLSTFSQVLKMLPAEHLSKVTSILISVDPKRDSLEKLEKYVSFFHENILGATASERELKEITKLYGVNYKIHTPELGKSYYVVDHSTQFFLLNKKGQIAELIPHGESSENLYKKVLKYIEEK